MLTGGFRTRSAMEEAIASGALDVVGMARPFTHNTRLALNLLDGSIERASDPPPILGLSRLKGMSSAAMSIVQMALIAEGKEPTSRVASVRALGAALLHEARSLRRAKVQEASR